MSAAWFCEEDGAVSEGKGVEAESDRERSSMKYSGIEKKG